MFGTGRSKEDLLAVSEQLMGLRPGYMPFYRLT